MRFSERTAWEAGDSAWATASAKAAGNSLLDLTVSNPVRCGLGMDPGAVLAPLGAPESLHYEPEPFGMRAARQGVSAYYRDHGVDVDLRSLCLTTSTSEAYSFLFRLLCDPGDEVLIATPSYPLLDLLAMVNDVTLRGYPLLEDPGALTGTEGQWQLDFTALREQVTPKTRAVVVVHPNNPTGHFVTPVERLALVRFCAEQGLALLVDEVFLDYALDAALPGARSFAGEPGCLCFVLSGLSKVCALPQMKASWIAASGPAQEVDEALARLEVIADTFLSMNAPIQHALPRWLAQRGGVQEAIRRRLQENLAVLDQRLQGSLGSRYGVEGGWTVVLRVPRYSDGELFALATLGNGVLVQPGSLYGMGEGRCVLSLLTAPAVWREGLERLPL